MVPSPITRQTVNTRHPSFFVMPHSLTKCLRGESQLNAGGFGKANIGVIPGLLRKARLRLPVDLIDADGIAESFDFAQTPFQAHARQLGVITFEGSKSGLTNDDATMAGNAFEATGEINFASEGRVVDLMSFRTHKTNDGNARVNAGSHREHGHQRKQRQPLTRALFVFLLPLLVFPLAF